MTPARMPAETDRHERTLMAWPTEQRREAAWAGLLDDARRDYVNVAHAIARFEPVTMVADPADAATARAALDPGVEVVALPIDDSWLRDSGPIFVTAPEGSRRARHFRFNGWGGKYEPVADDAAIGARLAEHLGVPVDDVPLVLEGGAIAVDGEGLLVTTERCLLHPNRNPGLTRDDIEGCLRSALGAQLVVWLADGIAEDDETDGHVDNVVAFHAPGRALLQGCEDPANPNRAIAADNRARLVAAGVDVTEVPHLPYASIGNESVPVPYVNLYACNGGVIVPTTGDARDDDMLAIVHDCFRNRQVVGVPGAVLAFGGGGVHCITQQVPAVA
jgi:agmatine deiminase